jgi:hypothetical protein
MRYKCEMAQQWKEYFSLNVVHYLFVRLKEKEKISSFWGALDHWGYLICIIYIF